MLELGKINHLTVKRATRHGAYLEDADGNEVLLPAKYVSDDLRLEDTIDVFLFSDSEDRVTATTQKPLAQRDEFAYLKVKDTSRHGAFLDWGLEKDLFVAFKEQARKMRHGESHLVYVYLDEQTNRLAASSRVRRFLENEQIDLEPAEKVDLLGWEKSDLGMNVIINNRYGGLIFEEDLHQNIRPGEKLSGYIKNIRPDKKIDVVLQKPGPEAVEPNAARILLKIRQNKGYLPLHDKSNPEEIKRVLQLSKKAFKKAIGVLYRKELIRIEEDGLYLNKDK